MNYKIKYEKLKTIVELATGMIAMIAMFGLMIIKAGLYVI